MTVKELIDRFEEVCPESKVVSPWTATINGVTKSGYTEVENVTIKLVDGKPVCIIG